ncbi:hypothetical protein GCM10029992_13820 [Glycomyces albus]
MKRRRALKWTLIGIGGGIGAVAIGGGGTLAYLYSQAEVDTVGKVDFDTPLAIPPEAQSETDSAGVRVFNLDVQSGQTRFKSGPATDTWGLNGSYLGPTIRARRGEEVAFAISNGLDEETSVHWHGMHLPAVMDGGPHQAIAPVTCGRRNGRSISGPPHCGTTRTRTGRRRSTSTGAWPGCSSSTTTGPTN